MQVFKFILDACRWGEGEKNHHSGRWPKLLQPDHHYKKPFRCTVNIKF